ncbi:hypothetical protein HYX15_03050 [Candidatus Woesearchaeota archaeon]|nr:hypothetical protein [Candidatus Woesearchaeota archaeon]
MKNQSQLLDLTLTEEELFRKRLKVKIQDPLGFKTTLGHSYSLVLESLAQEGLDDTPNPEEFIEYVAYYVKNRYGYSESREVERRRFLMPTYYPHIARAIWRYVEGKGLSEKRSSQIMREVLGRELTDFSPKIKFMSTSFTGSIE